jgi:hypothetical protein
LFKYLSLPKFRGEEEKLTSAAKAGFVPGSHGMAEAMPLTRRDAIV